MSLAYSGSIGATGPLPMVAKCQIAMNSAKMTSETTAARAVSERVIGRLPGAASACFLLPLAEREVGGLGSDGNNGERPARASFLPLGCSFDPEALDVILGLRRIERLAHDGEALRRSCWRREPDLLHQLGGVGREMDLLGDARVVDVALDLAPTLHLGEDPNRERLPRERIEIDALGIALHAAEAIGVGAGENLL